MRRKYEWELWPDETVMSKEITKRVGFVGKSFKVTEVAICENDTDENGETPESGPDISMQQMLKLSQGGWLCLYVPFPAGTVFPWREKRQR